MQLIFRRARMEGFIALDYAPDFPWARDRLTQWLREGKLTHREDLAHGLENAPATLMRLFKGDNMGKLTMKVR
jgi:NADPH-dependent curcumin reductase CurA